MNLMIATPAYNGMVHLNYLNSIMELTKENISFTLANLGNESLITRGRNTLFSIFIKNEQFDYLLFLDADIFISGKDVKKMIETNKDVIGAAVPLKGMNNGSPVYNFGKQLGVEILPNGESIHLVEKIGTAVFMLSRKAALSLVDYSKSTGNIYKKSMLTKNGEVLPEEQYNIFQTSVEREEYQSEDFFVCNRLRELGYNIYMMDSVVTKHAGMVQF